PLLGLSLSPSPGEGELPFSLPKGFLFIGFIGVRGVVGAVRARPGRGTGVRCSGGCGRRPAPCAATVRRPLPGPECAAAPARFPCWCGAPRARRTNRAGRVTGGQRWPAGPVVCPATGRAAGGRG